MTDETSLPTDCPDCGNTMETRGEVMVHMLYALGDEDHRAEVP